MSAQQDPNQQDQGLASASYQAKDAQLQKLKTSTEKPFPNEFREGSKTPFLHQFTATQLREGLIHATTANKTLLKELDSLIQIYEDRYSTTKHMRTSKGIMDTIEKDLEIEYDEDVSDEEDQATAIRQWENLTGFDEERMLRYTVCVISRKNDKIRKHIKGFQDSIAKTQGDI